MPKRGESPEKGGSPLSVDAAAESADPSLPAFLARPADKPVYHGFTVLDGVEADGFRLGTISRLGPEDYGDAFVIAPDDSRAGLVWKLEESRDLIEVSGFEPGRWGVWAIELPCRMASPEDARRNLQALLPALRTKWQEWKGSGFA